MIIKNNYLVLVFFLLVISLFGCSQTEKVIVDEWTYYSFDSSTIIKKFSKTSINEMFIKELSPVAISPKHGEVTTDWSPDDYFLIAKSVHEMEWKENVKYWTPYGQVHYYDCSNIQGGPIVMSLTYFKNENGSRYVSYISIDKNVNIVRTRHTEYKPQVNKWIPLNSNSVLSAENALEMAEKSGGEELREHHGNLCHIVITYYKINSSRSTPQWEISYKQDDKFIMRFTLNANSGQVVEIENFE